MPLLNRHTQGGTDLVIILSSLSQGSLCWSQDDDDVDDEPVAGNSSWFYEWFLDIWNKFELNSDRKTGTFPSLPHLHGPSRQSKHQGQTYIQHALVGDSQSVAVCDDLLAPLSRNLHCIQRLFDEMMDL